MKQLRWTTNQEQAAYMRMRKKQNRYATKSNKCENWMADLLTQSEYQFSRQTIWGYRIFDFWFGNLGIAIELDGPEHDSNYDAYRDEYNFRRSGIVVLRVENWNEDKAHRAIGSLSHLGTWKERRAILGIDGHTKKDKRKLSSQTFKFSMLAEFIQRAENPSVRPASPLPVVRKEDTNGISGNQGYERLD